MRVLLIWELVPEQTKFFAIEPTEGELEILEQANSGFINTVDVNPLQEQALEFVNAAISSNSTGFEGAALAWVGRWVEKEIEPGSLPTIGSFDKAFNCGFIL